MLYLNVAGYFIELVWAILITDRILQAFYLPRAFGFFWWFTFSWVFFLFTAVHPWGLLLLLAWPLWWLWGPAYSR